MKGPVVEQGYSYEVASDEMDEVMRGYSEMFGTGGIDGIDPYSSNKSSNKPRNYLTVVYGK